MEILIVVFLGAWLSVSGILGYIALKKDFKSTKKEDVVFTQENIEKEENEL
jgi:hypothetical protein